jgi:hypothetical protein
MKFSNNAHAALGKPDTQIQAIEMTPEMKAKYRRVTGLVVDLLKQHSDGPLDAYMMLQFIQYGFEDAYGIRGGIIMGDNDVKA